MSSDVLEIFVNSLAVVVAGGFCSFCFAEFDRLLDIMVIKQRESGDAIRRASCVIASAFPTTTF